MALPTEKELEDYIWNNDNSGNLDDLNLSYYRKFRQFRIKKIGVTDLIYFRRAEPDYPIHYVTLVELKRDVVDVNCLFQSIRYASAMRKFFLKRKVEVVIRIVLVGNRISLPIDIKHLGGVLKSNIFIRCFTYHYENGHFYFTMENRFRINRTQLYR